MSPLPRFPGTQGGRKEQPGQSIDKAQSEAKTEEGEEEKRQQEEEAGGEEEGEEGGRKEEAAVLYSKRGPNHRRVGKITQARTPTLFRPRRSGDQTRVTTTAIATRGCRTTKRDDGPALDSPGPPQVSPLPRFSSTQGGEVIPLICVGRHSAGLPRSSASVAPATLFEHPGRRGNTLVCVRRHSAGLSRGSPKAAPATLFEHPGRRGIL